MIIRRRAKIGYSEVTPKAGWLNRRSLMAGAAASAAAALVSTDAAALEAASSGYSIGDPTTPLELVTSYNNFYEFGTDKGDPAGNAGTLTTQPVDA